MGQRRRTRRRAVARNRSHNARGAAAAAATRFSISITDRLLGVEHEARKEIGVTSRRRRSRSATARNARSPSAERPGRAAGALLERGVEIAIVKLGGTVSSSRPRTSGTWWRHSRSMSCALWAPAMRSVARSATALLVGMSPPEAVEFANAAGALVASRLLCADAMPSEPEVRELLEQPVRGAELFFPAGTLADGDRPGPRDARARGLGAVRPADRAPRAGRVAPSRPATIEVALLPLSGGGVTVDSGRPALRAARPAIVFTRVTDWAYPPMEAGVRLTSADGCELALASARATRRLEPRLVVAAGDVPASRCAARAG